MKLISWNMAGAGFHSARSHQDAWEWLLAEEFDVALLQEAVPPPSIENSFTSLIFRPYSLSRKFSWGNCIVSREIPLVKYQPTFDELWRTDIERSTLMAKVENLNFYFANIHSSAQIVTDKKSQELEDIGGSICHPEKLWDIEIAAHFLSLDLADKRFVVGGDLNSALLFDTVYRRETNRRLFENLENLGFHNLRLPFFRDEQQTYFKKGNRAYQLDHLFGDLQTLNSTAAWQVLTDVADKQLLSDHAPVAIEVTDLKFSNN